MHPCFLCHRLDSPLLVLVDDLSISLSVALLAVSSTMSFYTYPIFRPILSDHATTEGPSGSAPILSLSLSDIIDIPDEGTELAQAQTAPAPSPGAPHTPTRANAMSLGFILSEQMCNGPCFGPTNHTTFSPDTPSRPISVQARYSNLKGEDGETQILGWAPLDPDHHTLVDILELPVVLLTVTPSYVLSAEQEEATMVPGLSHTEGMPRLPSTQSNLVYPTNGTRTRVSTALGKPIAMPFPVSHLPSAHSIHTLASLSSVRRGLDFSAAPRPVLAPAATRSLVHSTQPSCAPRPALPQRSASGPSPRIPPAPRGGVPPALARSITNIRVARERALQSHTTRPRKEAARGIDASGSGDDAPAPSVLGRWVTET